MFRGFRLHLLALILAAVLFAFAAVFRASRITQVQPPPTVTAAPGVDEITAGPSSTPTPPPVEEQAATLRSPATDRAKYREGLVGTVGRLNPVFAHLNPVDQDITSLIFRGLFTTDKYGAPVLDLAESLTISGDKLEYVLELRQDISWQDGVAFGADDVIYTMSLLSDPDYAAYSPSADFWRSVETQKLGDHLVRFRLAQPLASFPRYLTIGLLPEHALRGTPVSGLAKHPFNLSPIGAGAYQLGELRAEASGKISAVLLQLSPVYERRGEAQNSHQLRELLFNLYSNADDAMQAYRRGEIDVLANIGSRADLLGLPGARLHTSIDSTVKILIFNWEEPAFANRRMRRALALGLDQTALVEARLAGEASYADSPLIPGMPVYQSNDFWNAHDPALAVSLLERVSSANSDAEESGDAEGEGNAMLDFSLLVGDSASLTGLAFDIAAQWRAIGLAVEVAPVMPDELKKRLRAGDFDAAIVSQRLGGEPDVYRFWHPAQSSTGQNYGSAAENEIAELLDSARRASNGLARHQMYQQFQESFAEKAIAIPLYYPLYSMIVRDSIDGVRLGFIGEASDRFRGISAWRLAGTAS
ncbi:MAG: ABC transporter substrate-binding protein [Chloroflexota bacterium]|nr:ABC transporter substrate-binding protein [Chloroflexota bacterium]